MAPVPTTDEEKVQVFLSRHTETGLELDEAIAPAAEGESVPVPEVTIFPLEYQLQVSAASGAEEPMHEVASFQDWRREMGLGAAK